MLRTFWKNNGLSLVLGVLFIATSFAQVVAGYHVYENHRLDHAESAIGFVRYLHGAHFLEALFENWESEFLQMGAFVLLSVKLRQRGSSESKPIGRLAEQDEDPNLHRMDDDAPGPVRRGGLALLLYRNSLALLLFGLFAISFVLHAYFGCALANEENQQHGKEAATLAEFLVSSQFWFESFQNWQSEFLAVFTLVVGSIYLRQYGSPQSKPVHAAHRETGA